MCKGEFNLIRYEIEFIIVADSLQKACGHLLTGPLAAERL